MCGWRFGWWHITVYVVMRKHLEELCPRYLQREVGNEQLIGHNYPIFSATECEQSILRSIHSSGELVSGNGSYISRQYALTQWALWTGLGIVRSLSVQQVWDSTILMTPICHQWDLTVIWAVVKDMHTFSYQSKSRYKHYAST